MTLSFVSFLLVCSIGGVALMLVFARLVEKYDRIEPLPLSELDMWRMKLAINLLDSALFEVSGIAERNESVRELEGTLTRSLRDARRILNESRRVTRGRQNGSSEGS